MKFLDVEFIYHQMSWKCFTDSLCCISEKGADLTQKVQIWHIFLIEKGADLTQKGAELTQKGADLTQKGADLTHFYQNKKVQNWHKKVQIWLRAHS